MNRSPYSVNLREVCMEISPCFLRNQRGSEIWQQNTSTYRHARGNVKMYFMTRLFLDERINIFWTQTICAHRNCWHDVAISGARIVTMARYCILTTMGNVITHGQTIQSRFIYPYIIVTILRLLKYNETDEWSVTTHATWWRHQMETFTRYWPFVRVIHRSPVDSTHKGQWHGALMFFICA